MAVGSSAQVIVQGRRDDGALLAVLRGTQCAVIIAPDGKQMWPTTTVSALSRGDWEAAEVPLPVAKQEEVLALLRAAPIPQCAAPGTAP
jgi:hypothetical protein